MSLRENWQSASNYPNRKTRLAWVAAGVCAAMPLAGIVYSLYKTNEKDHYSEAHMQQRIGQAASQFMGRSQQDFTGSNEALHFQFESSSQAGTIVMSSANAPVQKPPRKVGVVVTTFSAGSQPKSPLDAVPEAVSEVVISENVFQTKPGTKPSAEKPVEGYYLRLVKDKDNWTVLVGYQDESYGYPAKFAKSFDIGVHPLPAEQVDDVIFQAEAVFDEVEKPRSGFDIPTHLPI